MTKIWLKKDAGADAKADTKGGTYLNESKQEIEAAFQTFAASEANDAHTQADIVGSLAGLQRLVWELVQKRIRRSYHNGRAVGAASRGQRESS